jgi:hypothetical protein
LAWTSFSHSPHRPQFVLQAVICGKRIRSDDEAIEEMKYKIQISTRGATDAPISRWRKIIYVDGDLEEI